MGVVEFGQEAAREAGKRPKGEYSIGRSVGRAVIIIIIGMQEEQQQEEEDVEDEEMEMEMGTTAASVLLQVDAGRARISPGSAIVELVAIVRAYIARLAVSLGGRGRKGLLRRVRTFKGKRFRYLMTPISVLLRLFILLRGDGLPEKRDLLFAHTNWTMLSSAVTIFSSNGERALGVRKLVNGMLLSTVTCSCCPPPLSSQPSPAADSIERERVREWVHCPWQRSRPSSFLRKKAQQPSKTRNFDGGGVALEGNEMKAFEMDGEMIVVEDLGETQ
ncbi:hypothetical protein AXG93_1952s1070 [Marchantia polymorpha subsp. ruderalis]|uniref:Uncharacterized protein n=1 Tax=Marchantia polymorpha subsp. ruderalis TaxID=1480154 RepID=A0A176WMR5_MARPO|nr:hypothetical protein AXG93_1952s1070 [Marchantia polymorpha subsp. ruderalis]